MTIVTRSGSARIDTVTARLVSQLSGNLYAGEDLNACSPCVIRNDGLVYMSDGTAADANAHVDGFVPKLTLQGEPVTLYGPGLRMKFSDGNLTPGQLLYVAATAGELDDAATTGDATGVAKAYDTNDIYFLRYKTAA